MFDQWREDLEHIRRDGFVIFPDMLSVAELATLQCELEPFLARTPRCEGDFHGWKTTRVNGLLSKAPLVQELALHPRILAIANALLAPNCDCIRLNLTQAIRIHPGERAQFPHRDEEMWPIGFNGRVVSLNVMWALSDFTAANGATRLWPGSHMQRLGHDPDPGACVSAEMKAGAALVYLGGLTHGGGANVSNADRTGIVIGYCVGWLRTYEEQFLAYTREEACAFPEELQRLIGYQTHRPNIGHWEGRDPIEYLKGEKRAFAHQDALPPEIAHELKSILAARDG